LKPSCLVQRGSDPATGQIRPGLNIHRFEISLTVTWYQEEGSGCDPYLKGQLRWYKDVPKYLLRASIRKLSRRAKTADIAELASVRVAGVTQASNGESLEIKAVSWAPWAVSALPVHAQ
jgi:hypothetical protein